MVVARCSVAAAPLPPSVASTSLVASSLQPPAFGPVLHEGTSLVRGGEWSLGSRYRVVCEPFPPRAHNFPTAHGHGSAGAQSTPCHRPPAPRPTSSPPFPPCSISHRTHEFAPHARTPRSPFLSTPLPRAVRGVSVRHHRAARVLPLSLSSLSPVFSPGAPSPGGGAPSVMTRAADDRHFGGRHE